MTLIIVKQDQNDKDKEKQQTAHMKESWRKCVKNELSGVLSWKKESLSENLQTENILHHCLFYYGQK